MTAQYNLALVYENGQGVEQDHEEAVLWFRNAADQGFALAQFKLANIYSNGQGVSQDLAQGVAWYRRAADQGHAESMHCLGVLYFRGIGVTKDRVESLKWRNLAVAHAPSENENEYIASRDSMAVFMTPEELADAQQRASEWMAVFEKHAE